MDPVLMIFIILAVAVAIELIPVKDDTVTGVDDDEA